MGFKSVIVEDTEHCFICGSPYVECHHVIHGTANRKLADKYHLTLPLCNKHHTGSALCPHRDALIDRSYKVMGQEAFERIYGTRDDFRRIFGKSYIG